MKAQCSIPGCEKDARARGWCGAHYALWRKHGDPLVKKGRWDNHVRKLNTCSVPGCERQQYKKKMCSMHQTRMLKYGDPNIVKPHKRLYEFNEEILDTWTPESAYFLGWVVSDGSVYDVTNSDTRAVVIEIQDKEVLETLRQILGHSKELTTSRGHWKLRVHSMHLVKRLNELGVKPHKSFNVTMPPVPESMLSHFVRGVVEGDGSLVLQSRGYAGHYLRAQINSASPKFLLALADAIPFKGSYFEVGKGKRKNPLYRIVYSGKEALRFCDWIYRNSDGMRLSRKYERYLAAKE